jgi:hypothetical protein
MGSEVPVMDETEALRKELIAAKREIEDLRIRLRNVELLYFSELKAQQAKEAPLKLTAKFPSLIST